MNMMAEHLLKSMSYIGEDLIHEAEQPVKRNHFLPVAGSLIAAALLLVFLTLPGQTPISYPLPLDPVIPDEPNEIHINWLENDPTSLQGALKVDMDVEIMTHLIPDEETRQQWLQPVPGNEELDPELREKLFEEYQVWEALMAEFSAAVGTDGDALLTALQEEFEITDFYTRLVREEKDAPHTLIHDYCLNLRTEAGGTAIVSLSTVGKPLRCYFVYDETPLLSRINGTELVIDGCELNGGTLYLTRFTEDNPSADSGCTWYDVETQGFESSELETLLEILLSGYDA